MNSIKTHPVILLPPQFSIYDLTQTEDRQLADSGGVGIGKYNERREGMYSTPLFHDGRTIHMGIDFFSPIGTPVYSWADGRIHLFGNNANPGDYGYTIVTEHRLGERPIYSLYGHLSEPSLKGKRSGQSIRAGEIIGWIGDRHENGGWTPHLHFQLSWEKPAQPDLPGVIHPAKLLEALQTYPDPRIILGPIYI